jgi:hypothetical protein
MLSQSLKREGYALVPNRYHKPGRAASVGFFMPRVNKNPSGCWVYSPAQIAALYSKA